MAWIVKQSATTKIPTRDEPYLTDAMKARYEKELLPRYETKMGALMPILHDMQHEYNHIPYQAMVEIATFLEITPGDVLDTVSFYEEYHTEPVGKYVIGVCQSIACEVCGHQAIIVRGRDGSTPASSGPRRLETARAPYELHRTQTLEFRTSGRGIG
jgi:NADH-quinone oxidoreductase subunit E